MPLSKAIVAAFDCSATRLESGWRTRELWLATTLDTRARKRVPSGAARLCAQLVSCGRLMTPLALLVDSCTPVRRQPNGELLCFKELLLLHGGSGPPAGRATVVRLFFTNYLLL